MKGPLFVLCLLAGVCSATSYGRSKLQTGTTDWWEIATPRFTVYYPQGAEAVAESLVVTVEQELTELAGRFGYIPSDPVPIILYVSPGAFRQTDIISSEIEEAVGGFTEYLKGRVVIPFTGSWSEFRHVLTHEINHAYIFDMLYRRSLDAIIMSKAPLWTVEGLAEYTSAGWDDASEAEYREMVISGQTVSIEELGRRGDYLVYREGQAVYRFIEERYGEERLRLFVRHLGDREGVDGAMQAAFEMTTGQFDERFQEWSRENYWSELAFRESPADVGSAVTRGERRVLTWGAAISSDGNLLAGLESYHGGLAVTVRSTVDGSVVERCFETGGVSSTGLGQTYRICAFSPAGDSLAVAWHDVSSDRLSIRTGGGTTDLPFSFDMIRDPAWSPSGGSIAFAGMTSGRTDIYRIDLPGLELTRLTDTEGGERDLSWADEGILAASEEPSERTSTIILCPPGGGTPEVLARSGDELRYPFMTDSGLVCMSGGASPDLFLFRGDGPPRRLTSLYRTIDTPAWADSAGVLTFLANGWTGSGNYLCYDLLTRTPPEPQTADTTTPAPTRAALMSALVPEPAADSIPQPGRTYLISPYSPRLSTDYVSALAGYDSYSGLEGYTTFMFSDILAHHRLLVNADFSGNVTDADAGVYYTYLPLRTDFGLGVYRQSTLYLFRFSDGHQEEVRDVDMGAGVGIRYPFSPALKLEAGVDYRRLSRTGVWNSDADYDADVLAISSGLVLDTALWDWVGPRVGSRLSARAEMSPGAGGLADYTTVLGDMRHYVWISGSVSLALRLAGGMSWGDDAQRFYIGGAVPHRALLGETDSFDDLVGFYGNYGDMLRGLRYTELSGSKYFSTSAEFRIPFVRTMALDAPIPMTLSGIRGAIFMDAGTAFDDFSSFVGVDTEGGLRLRDIAMGIGFGFRANLGIILIREDTAWETDLYGISRKPRHYFSLGACF